MVVVIVVDVAVDVDVVVVTSTSTAKPGKCMNTIHLLSTIFAEAIFSDSDKKIHQTWGGDEGTSELKAEEGAVKDATAETADEWGSSAPADAWGDSAPADGAAAEGADKGSRPRRERGERGDRGDREREPKEPEEEDNTLTLEQYLAEKKVKDDALVPKLDGFRAANDGADDLWKDAVALEKGDDEAYFAAKVSIDFRSVRIIDTDVVFSGKVYSQAAGQEGGEGLH